MAFLLITSAVLNGGRQLCLLAQRNQLLVLLVRRIDRAGQRLALFGPGADEPARIARRAG